VVENHFWSTGAVLEMTKKGNPMVVKSSRKTHKIGFEETGGLKPSAIPMGRTMRADQRRTRWKIDCLFTPSHLMAT
jgi:hypothetical protein